MKYVMKENIFAIAFVACLIAFGCLVCSGADRVLSAEPATKDSPAPEKFEPIAKAIQQKVKELEYPDDVGQDLVKMVSGWKCEAWKQRLDQARQELQEKKISTDQLAEVEEDVTKELFHAIRKEIDYDRDLNFEYCKLSKIIEDKKAHCFGYSLLFFVLGDSLGLSTECLYVTEPPYGSFPVSGTHMASLVNLSNNKILMVDAAWGFVSRPFVLNEEFTEDGPFWQLKDKSNALGIHRRIQLCNENGLLAEIYSSRAYESAMSKNNADCISLSTKAVQLNPLNGNGYLFRAGAYSNLGKYEDALSDCQKAIELDRQSARPFLSRGLVYCAMDKTAEGISDFNKAIELDPKDAYAYNCLGNTYLRTNKYQESISAYDQAIKIGPKNAAAHYGRGLAYAGSGKYLEALSEITRSMELDPKNVDADKYFDRGVVFYHSVIFTEAISDFTKAIELSPNNANEYLWRGLTYSKMERNKDAMSDLTKTIELNPKCLDAYLNRALVYSHDGSNTEAVSDYTKAMELDPNNSNAYNGRAHTYYVLGKYVEAASDATKAIDLKPTNAYAYLLRASAEVVLEQKDKAVKDLQKAVKLDPTLTEDAEKLSAQYQLGLSLPSASSISSP